MSDTFYLIALGALVGGAGLIIWRGMRQKPKPDANQEGTGGGAGDGGGAD